VLRTANAEFARQISVLERIASADVTVLLHGESGTGKELMAQAIHELSERTGAFVAVNCGAIPANLLEAQLFGHKKGAFSGATADAPGLIRAAQDGTLFLDEIAELSEPSQVALLRALQEKEVLPVGCTEPVSVDVRFLAATHQDLPARIAAGRFREDLYARISGFIVELPPLRERMEDLGLLIRSMVQRLAPERAEVVGFTRRAANALFAYTWPRNIRELEATLAAALAIAVDDTVAFEHLPQAIKTPVIPGEDDELTPSERELHNAVSAELKAQRGNVTATAKSLGYSRSHFHRLLKRLGIEPQTFRR
jgi:DNA-binding NtrC family response regulator